MEVINGLEYLLPYTYREQAEVPLVFVEEVPLLKYHTEPLLFLSQALIDQKEYQRRVIAGELSSMPSEDPIRIMCPANPDGTGRTYTERRRILSKSPTLARFFDSAHYLPGCDFQLTLIHDCASSFYIVQLYLQDDQELTQASLRNLFRMRSLLIVDVLHILIRTYAFAMRLELLDLVHLVYSSLLYEGKYVRSGDTVILARMVFAKGSKCGEGLLKDWVLSKVYQHIIPLERDERFLSLINDDRTEPELRDRFMERRTNMGIIEESDESGSISEGNGQTKVSDTDIEDEGDDNENTLAPSDVVPRRLPSSTSSASLPVGALRRGIPRLSTQLTLDTQSTDRYLHPNTAQGSDSVELSPVSAPTVKRQVLSLHSNGEKALKLLGMDTPVAATPDSGIPTKAQQLLGLNDVSGASSVSPTKSRKAISVLGIEVGSKPSTGQRRASIQLPGKENHGHDITPPQTSNPGTPNEKGRKSSDRGKRVLKMELKYDDDLSLERAKQRMKTMFGDELKIVDRPTMFGRSRSNPFHH